MMLGYGLGTNSMILSGFAVSYGEVVIVLPDTIPASIALSPFLREPVELYAENNYDGVTLYLNDEWNDFLQQIPCQVLFSAKQRFIDKEALFEAQGVHKPADKTVVFSFTSEQTNLMPRSNYRWEVSSNRVDPDLYQTIINGKMIVRPIIRRVNS
jgi:hypothetical protein